MPNDSSTSPDPDAGPDARPDAGSNAVLDNSARHWNALNRGENPFSDHRFLAAVEETDCVGGDTGWVRADVGCSPQDRACAPAWLKDHSHGEFVFDFIWADAAHRAGMPWYPKLLVAAPFSPVPGPRILGADDTARAGLLGQLEDLVEEHRLSSGSINFCDAADNALLEGSAWLPRRGWQFHWHNRGYRTFDDFLSDLKSKPRKNIRRERRLAHANGWRYRWVDGAEISADELRLVGACYRTTFALYGNLPSLNTGFFSDAARRFGPQFLVCIASRNDEDRACSVFWKSPTRLYGRYWGALEETRDVHFEACYYQGIEYCIAHGLEAFEPGAQGEHKIRRGFLPVKTFSWHYIRHPGLRAGISQWLGREGEALDAYRTNLESLNPFRDPESS